MIRKAKGIVIKKFNFRETSLLVIFFTKEFGKIKGIIKGVRKDPRKIASNLALCSYNEIVFYEKRNSELCLITQCDVRKDFSYIREDIQKVSLASYVLELTDVVMQLGDQNLEVFKLLLDSFKSMQSVDLEKVLYCFQVKVLSLSGFKPHLDACIICKDKLHGAANFSIALGGLICSVCAGNDINSNTVLKGTINSLIHLETFSWHKALTLGLSKQIRQELRSILYNFLSFHLEKSMKSFQFLANPI
ncbi:DNA repair protein RecO [Candidatus Omnitrophota bacterium]